MAKLPKFTLGYHEKKDKWVLEQDKTNTTVKTFETKADATAGGVLQKALGKDGGSVKIQKVSGKYQEERTYPRKADPKESPG